MRRIFGRKSNFQAKAKTADSEAFDETTADFIQGSLDLVARMQRQGVDITQSRYITHLFIGSDGDLLRASKLLALQGFTTIETGNEHLLVGDDAVVDEGWILRTVPAMCMTAGEFNLAYDGWDVDVADNQSTEGQ